MRISIVGAGYVGLVTAVGLGTRGHSVVCVDKDSRIVDHLNKGKLTIYEPGLEELFVDVIAKDRFSATTSIDAAVSESELTIIAVGTPNKHGQIDLNYVCSAAQEIGDALRNKPSYHTVVVKSTVLPGTTESVVLPILREHSGKDLGDFGLGFNPEFLREGNAVEDFMDPDRIVLGADDPISAGKLLQLYVGWDTDFIETNTKTAEMIKYVSNCFLATQISLANEIANLATKLGNIDIIQVMQALHLDRRWNPKSPDGGRINPGILSYLMPGCGFGGSCFPKDIQALAAQGKQVGLPMRILEAVLQVNEEQPFRIVDLLLQGLGSFNGKRIAVLGLAFKPETDDIRHSPAIPIIEKLVEMGAQVVAADPVAHKKAEEVLSDKGVLIFDEWKAAVRGADAVAIITAWDEYRNIAPEQLKSLMRGNLIVDGRNICTHLKLYKELRTYSIGCVPSDHIHPTS